MKENTRQVYYEDEVTLKELILKIQEYLREVVRNWKIIGLACLFTTMFFIYKHFTFIPTYNAELRFVVEGQGGGGGLSSILGSFGIKKVGKVNPYKIIEVGKSSKLFEDVIFTKYSGDTTIADKILTEYDLVNKWSAKNEKYRGGHFINDTMKRHIEKSVFKRLHTLVWGGPNNTKNALSKLTLDEERGIYTLSTKSTSEKLGIVLTNRFYQGIKLFFEEAIFENQKRSGVILAAKADSLNNLRMEKIYQLARFEDRNNGLILKENSTKVAILSQEIQALGMTYAEVVKNYEMTDVNLKDLQPLFMEIDRPFSPIAPSHSSLLKNLILGLLLGGFLGIMLVTIRKIYSEVMN